MTPFGKIACCKCSEVKEMINSFNGDYMGNLYKLDALAEQGTLDLYAGDSPIGDVRLHCEKEDRYTINHYFKCNSCGDFYFIGFCCRGGYVFKQAIDMANLDFNHLFEGKDKLGTYFKNYK